MTAQPTAELHEVDLLMRRDRSSKRYGRFEPRADLLLLGPRPIRRSNLVEFRWSLRRHRGARPGDSAHERVQVVCEHVEGSCKRLAARHGKRCP